MPRPVRGEVWTVRFDPAEGAEIQGRKKGRESFLDSLYLFCLGNDSRPL